MAYISHDKKCKLSSDCRRAARLDAVVPVRHPETREDGDDALR